MEVKPNSQQDKFIESKNSNVLVSASAGSGKTYSMIKKLIQILCVEKTPITSLLVLTFTEAAASEIKQRLYNEISIVMSEREEDREFLQSQLDNINNAEIGTLHSVCKKLIIKYFYELDQTPDFSVLSEKESKYLIDSAITSVFEKHILSDDNDFFHLYDCYNARRNDVSLKEIVITFFNYISNKLDYKDWIKEFLKNAYNCNLNENSVCKYLYDINKKRYYHHIKGIEDLKSQAVTNNYEKYIDFLNNKCQVIDEILQSKDFTQLFKIINNIPTIKKPSINKNMTAEELEFDEKVAELNKSITATIKKTKTDFIFDNIDDVKENFLLTKINVDKLISIVEEIKIKYEEYKKNKNYLDFNDLEDKMLKLITVDNVIKSLKDSYKYVFFDEYQDINEKQEKILSQIVSGDNYYMIGDVKQSIYAFRQSSPKIFIEKFNKFKDDDEKNKLINFNLNYRSDRNILEFNNFVFDNLITEKTIGIDYKNNSRFDSINKYQQCNVDVKIINTAIESEEDDEDIEKDKCEAVVIADSIAKILTKTKSDGKRFTYRDIAIITRRRGSFVKTLCDTLIDMQIPISATVNNDFFEMQEVNVLISILKTVSNFKDDIALAIVLKNLFNITEKELLEIKQSSNEKFFYDSILTYSNNNETKDKIDDFFKFLDKAHNLLNTLSIKDFMEEVIDEFSLENYFKSLPGGEEKEQNIYEFLSIMDNDLYKYNLDKFLDYLEYISKDSTLQKIGINGNAVQICTIHYSKGLEYPAVILAGLGKKFTINKDTNDIIINNDFGIGLKAIDNKNRILKESLIRVACKNANKEGELNEEIRLLYVAMTRPKEYLCLIGTYNMDKFQESKEKDVYMSNNYFDMIFKSVEKKR